MFVTIDVQFLLRRFTDSKKLSLRFVDVRSIILQRKCDLVASGKVRTSLPSGLPPNIPAVTCNTVQELAAVCPCVVCITHLDEIIAQFESSSLFSSFGSPHSTEAMLCDGIAVFLSNLVSETAGKSVWVVLHTSVYSQLPLAIRDLFSIDISLTESCDTTGLPGNCTGSSEESISFDRGIRKDISSLFYQDNIRFEHENALKFMLEIKENLSEVDLMQVWNSTIITAKTRCFNRQTQEKCCADSGGGMDVVALEDHVLDELCALGECDQMCGSFTKPLMEADASTSLLSDGVLTNAATSAVSQSEYVLCIHESDAREAYSKYSAMFDHANRSCKLTAKSPFSGVNQQIAPVQWSDIGGMSRVRREILDVIELPMKHPYLFEHPTASPPVRNGILLYGPPGTGKTMVARAVATECKMAFLSIKGPELLDAYVGGSEQQVRSVFASAADQAPCVLFFDELDSLAPQRGNKAGEGGGAMDRVVSQLLTEIDLVNNPKPTTDPTKSQSSTATAASKRVFIIAATNRPDLLDMSLLRPGRLDRKICLSVAQCVEDRCNILKAQTRKFTFNEDVSLEGVAKLLPPRVTGADIGSLSSTAYGLALERKLATLESDCKRLLMEERSAAGLSHEESMLDFDVYLSNYVESLPPLKLVVTVSQDDFLVALSELKCSVSAEDLLHYEMIGKQYDDIQRNQTRNENLIVNIL